MSLLLQSRLEAAFVLWQPTTPEVTLRGRRDLTLSWLQHDLEFLATEDLLYRLEKKEKIPPWVVVYSGGKSTKRIDNLTPCSPHKFRLRVIIKADEVHNLAKKAEKFYGSEEIAVERMKTGLFKNEKDIETNNAEKNGDSHDNLEETSENYMDGSGDKRERTHYCKKTDQKPWLESQWSEEICTSTESEGTSSTCFSMAVRGGYLKQVQILLEERPELIGIINSTNGFTPLATAVRKGDLNMVRYLLTMGAEVDQRSSTGQTALHLAVLGAHPNIAELLLEKGADFKARDLNDLRVEHYAVDSGDLDTLRFVLERGKIDVTDNNGWTPLFRAICQGSSTRIIDELVQRGSEIDINDAAGLSLAATARLLTNRHGRARESIMRMVDAQYPHEKAVANFTRLTKKISSLHTLFKTG